MSAPICPYCGQPSKRATGHDLYPHREDLYDKKFYWCKPCDAYVGCHEKTGRAFGTLAHAGLRQIRSATHRAFDPLWLDLGYKYVERRRVARTRAYAILAEHLGIDVKDCHIGMFDEAMCVKAMEICKNKALFAGI